MTGQARSPLPFPDIYRTLLSILLAYQSPGTGRLNKTSFVNGGKWEYKEVTFSLGMGGKKTLARLGLLTC